MRSSLFSYETYARMQMAIPFPKSILRVVKRVRKRGSAILNLVKSNGKERRDSVYRRCIRCKQVPERPVNFPVIDLIPL